MTTTFNPTHRIFWPGSEPVELMLVDGGAAYTLAEWQTASAADYERNDDGDWLFQGQPFSAIVESMEPSRVEKIARRAVLLTGMTSHGQACRIACREFDVPAEDLYEIIDLVSQRVTELQTFGR
jgi:hypothetical protein